RMPVATIPVGNKLGEIVFGAGALWVADAGLGTSADPAALLRIDPGNNQAVSVQMATNVTEFALHVEATDSAVFLLGLSDMMLTRVDPKSATVSGQVKLDSAGGGGGAVLAAGAGRLVVADYSTGRLLEVDPSSLAVTNTETGISDQYGEPALF